MGLWTVKFKLSSKSLVTTACCCTQWNILLSAFPAGLVCLISITQWLPSCIYWVQITVLEYVPKPIKQLSFVCRFWQLKSDKGSELITTLSCWSECLKNEEFYCPSTSRPFSFPHCGCLHSFTLFPWRFSSKSGFMRRQSDLWPLLSCFS